MRRQCPTCGHHWAWELADGRFKCRGCQVRYRVRVAWAATRLSEAVKRRLVDYFVLGGFAQKGDPAQKVTMVDYQTEY